MRRSYLKGHQPKLISEEFLNGIFVSSVDVILIFIVCAVTIASASILCYLLHFRFYIHAVVFAFAIVLVATFFVEFLLRLHRFVDNQLQNPENESLSKCLSSKIINNCVKKSDRPIHPIGRHVWIRTSNQILSDKPKSTLIKVTERGGKGKITIEEKH